MSRGIDYGLGRSNIDPETGIRYGVISQHSLSPEAASEVWMEGAVYMPYCPHCHEVFECDPNSVDAASVDRCDTCGKAVEEWDYADEPSYIEYHEQTPDGEIVILDCLDSDFMIIKSPYVTPGAFCSPCVPGAVNLDDADADGTLAYCLPNDFFGSEAPYPYDKREE